MAPQALREEQTNVAMAHATAKIEDRSMMAPTNDVADVAGSDDGTQGKKDIGKGGVEVGSVLLTSTREGRGVLRPEVKASPSAAGRATPPSRVVRGVRVSTGNVWGGVCGNCCFRIILDYMSKKCSSQSFFWWCFIASIAYVSATKIYVYIALAGQSKKGGLSLFAVFFCFIRLTNFLAEPTTTCRTERVASGRTVSDFERFAECFTGNYLEVFTEFKRILRPSLSPFPSSIAHARGRSPRFRPKK